MAKITNVTKAKIFSLYYGQMCTINGTEQRIDHCVFLKLDSLKTSIIAKQLKDGLSARDVEELVQIFVPNNTEKVKSYFPDKRKGYGLHKSIFVIEVQREKESLEPLLIQIDTEIFDIIISEVIDNSVRDLSEPITTHAIDYLRSSGYVLPYLHYTQEELIKAKVFKVIT